MRAWLRAHRWLVARRCVQALTMLAFVAGPWWGLWIAEGTLAGSLWFGHLSLTDPFVVVQSIAAGHAPAAMALVGAAVVAAVYALSSGRLFCAWVCPINAVTDLANGLRRAFGLRVGLRIDRRLRHVVMVAALVASAVGGVIAWELVNPITLGQRALVFGLATSGGVAVAGVFLFDLLVVRNGWCGHLCPVGAFYGWLGWFGRLRVVATRRDACTHCGDCYRVCPEPQVIVPVLQPRGAPRQWAVTSQDCLRCGRCVEACGQDVFELRLNGRLALVQSADAVGRLDKP